MTVTSNMHNANKAVADGSGSASWVTFYSDGGHVAIFMPLDKAEAVAAVFNALEVEVSIEPKECWVALGRVFKSEDHALAFILSEQSRNPMARHCKAFRYREVTE